MTDLTDEQLREWFNEHTRAPWITTERKYPQNIYGKKLLTLLTELLALRSRVAREAQLEAALREIVHNDDGVCEQIALRALAQPAESEATGIWSGDAKRIAQEGAPREQSAAEK